MDESVAVSKKQPLEIYGPRTSPKAYAIRDFLYRSDIPFIWVELKIVCGGGCSPRLCETMRGGGGRRRDGGHIRLSLPVESLGQGFSVDRVSSRCYSSLDSMPRRVRFRIEPR
jgi:hypothetical protein